MGLDTVELIIAIEREFELEIPNEEAAKLETVGLIFDYLIKHQELAKPLTLEERDLVWEKLKNIVVHQLGVRPEEVIMSAHLVNDLGAD